MASRLTPFLLLLSFATTVACNEELEAVRAARFGLLQGETWARTSLRAHGSKPGDSGYVGEALGDCVKLYEESENRMTRLVSGETRSRDDALAWLSSALASHRTCVDGLEGKGLVEAPIARNLTAWLTEALALYAKCKEPEAEVDKEFRPTSESVQPGVMLAEWSPNASRADIVVAADGTGDQRTINEAIAALTHGASGRTRRVVVYVKAGIYDEKVEIGRNLKNLMFVGDGIGRTIITANRNVHDGATTRSSATFGVAGDGFWARDITFENRAGPKKAQAVAVRVSSDLSVFYRCSFKGYQDTLYVHSNRQFFRDCQIYGATDFIFGNAAVIFQNCDIYVRRPKNQTYMIITAQGRDTPEEATGISIQGSRVLPSPEIKAPSGAFRSYLGRPWRRYSRTVFLETDLDGLVDPRGWLEWSGNYGLSTLYYGEYKNSGAGASVGGRVNWPGFHVINAAADAMPFTVREFIKGHAWIPASGVPFYPGINELRL